MATLDGLRRGSADDDVPGETTDDVTSTEEPELQADRSDEEGLRARLTDDPNDVEAFDRLAAIVRSRAGEGHESGDPQREADDSVWALAEEIAHNGRAWYPLIELARLSIDDDREVALRRLATAAERDPTGQALAQGLLMLRESGHSVDALNLGVGHWRPREHVIEAARQLIEASLEAERYGEAKRHLDALAGHADEPELRAEFETRIAADHRGGLLRVDHGLEGAGPSSPGPTPAGATGAGGTPQTMVGAPALDLRDKGSSPVNLRR